MGKRLFLAVGVPALMLVVMAGCGHKMNNDNPAADMTNSTPGAVATTNISPVTNNTDLILSTNLTTNRPISSNTNNP